MCRRIPPGTQAVLEITGLDHEDMPITGLDSAPDFARTDEFNGEGFNHRITQTGPKGIAVTDLTDDGWIVVTNQATGQVVYRADMTRST